LIVTEAPEIRKPPANNMNNVNQFTLGEARTNPNAQENETKNESLTFMSSQ